MPQVSPILPFPAWFFNDLLVSESKDCARIMAAFIQQSLDSKETDIPASFRDIENWTGLVPDRLSANLTTLREKGYLIRVKEGKLNTKTGAKQKAVYSVNWDCKEKGTELRVRQVYSHISGKYDVAESSQADHVPEFNVAGNMAKIAPKLKPGERVRVGRFGDEVSGRKWFSVGFDPVREKMANGPVGVMMRKLADGKFDELTSRDILSYWEHRYLQRHNVPYIPFMGRDLGIINKLRKVIDQKQILRLIRWLFDSGQKQYFKPNVGVLGSRFINDINARSIAWVKSGGN